MSLFYCIQLLRKGCQKLSKTKAVINGVSNCLRERAYRTTECITDFRHFEYCPEQQFSRGYYRTFNLPRQSFFQILEGEPTLVAACYSRITLDKRHTKLALMWEGEVAKRTFPSWTMGYCTPDELSPQCKDTLISLAKLKNDQGSVLVGNAVAVTLAKWIMREFPNVQ